MQGMKDWNIKVNWRNAVLEDQLKFMNSLIGL